VSKGPWGINERFGDQVGQLLGATEQRSARIPWMRKRVAEAATTQMVRMGVEDPLHPPAGAC
jgi:hypothetical protein